MASLKYRYTIFIQRRFQWLGFDGLLYFLSVWEAGIQNCITNRNFSPAIGGWRAQRREDCPLTPGLALEPPLPRTSLWPRHSSRLRPWPRSEVPRPETERGEMRLWCPLASLASSGFPGLAPTQDTLHSGLLVAKKTETRCKIFTFNSFVGF